MNVMPRLAAPDGLLIDRSKPVTFSFEGRPIQGYEGDSIASALLGAGVKVLSRSFKYHRPRGVLTMAGQDANTLVQLPGAPNVLADRTPVAEGLDVRGQNYKGSLDNDRLMVLDRFARFLPVGFYYKSFFKPGLFGGGSWPSIWPTTTRPRKLPMPCGAEPRSKTSSRRTVLVIRRSERPDPRGRRR